MTNPLKRATDRAKQEQAQKENSVDQAKRVDKQITDRLSEIRSLRNKLPAELGNTLFKIVYLPVVALFPNRNFTDTRLLEKAGFQTYQFPGDDLKDYPVLANQAILLIDFAKFDEMYAAKKREDSQDKVADHKQALADWKEANLEWEAQVAQAEQEIADWLEEKASIAKRQAKFDAYLEAAREYDAKYKVYIQEQKDFKAGKLNKMPVKPVKPIPVKPPKVLGTQPEPFDEEAHPRPKRPKPLSRNFNIDIDDMSDIVVELTRDLRELLNVDYVLMSAQHRKNPKNSNIICFWLAERWKHKKLEKTARVSVDSWNFAFE